MSVKLGQILSELATDVRAINLDDRISFRYLHSKFMSKIEYFMRLESKNREILKDPSSWKTISCLELEDVNNNSCGYIDTCNTLKRSKIKIPEAVKTNRGPIIKVYTIDNNTEIFMIRAQEYSDYTKRQYGKPKMNYWLEDDYLYIPNTTIEAVKVVLIPKDESEVDAANGDSESSCSSVLDTNISYPDHLITLAKQEVLKEISSVYKQIVEDEKGDNNTNNKK